MVSPRIKGKTSSEKVNQATQVTPIQNTKEKKPKYSPVAYWLQRINGPENPEKVEQERRTVENVNEPHVAAIAEKENGFHKEDVKAWKKMTPRERRDRRKVGPEIIVNSKRGKFSRK